MSNTVIKMSFLDTNAQYIYPLTKKQAMSYTGFLISFVAGFVCSNECVCVSGIYSRRGWRME